MSPLTQRALAGLAIVCAMLGGCATVAPPGGAASAVSREDPFESFNRKMFGFNEALDEAVLKPVAEVYEKLVPALVRKGVSNFFGNVGDLWSSANHFLQGKPATGLEMGFRVMVNTTIGLAGVLDPATEMGMTRRSEDLGQTLAVWGVSSGPYVVLPLFGPSSMRDTFALPVDRYYSSLSRITDDYNNYVVTPLQLVNVRAELLSTTKLAGEVSLDKYTFFRDAWFSRRLDQIYDGAAPLENMDIDDEKKDDKKAPPKK